VLQSIYSKSFTNAAATATNLLQALNAKNPLPDGSDKAQQVDDAGFRCDRDASPGMALY